MLFYNITILDENFNERKNVCVGIKNGKVDHIGEFRDGYGEITDGDGLLLVPALCSAHSHSAMTLFRGVGSGLPLQRWLNEAIFPLEAKLTERDVYNGTLTACAEMLKYGVASCNDMYFFSSSMAKAYLDTGFKANISLPITRFDDTMQYETHPMYREAEDTVAFLGGNNGDVRMDLAVHAVYTNTLNSIKGVCKHAERLGTGITVHISETERENSQCLEKYGMTPTALFEKCGMFNCRTSAAHCVYCTDEDYEIMAKHGVFMASCPTSNLKLGNGIPDYTKPMSKNVTVCLGTDGVASNNNLNMIKEAKLMALLTNGLTHDASACKAETAIRSATENGWLSLGRQNSGLIKVGMDADLAVFDLRKVNTRFSRNAADTLIYSCDGEAYMTVVNGKVLYKNGEYTTIDTERLHYEIGE